MNRRTKVQQSITKRGEIREAIIKGLRLAETSGWRHHDTATSIKAALEDAGYVIVRARLKGGE